MTKARAIAVRLTVDNGVEALRLMIVCGCAMALIMAGRI
jgi:hypothetical protein